MQERVPPPLSSYFFDTPFIPLQPPPTWDTLLAHPNEPWDYWKLAAHPDLPWSTVTQLPHKSWNWATLSRHPDLDFDTVFTHPDKHWDWRALSAHPRLTTEILAAHPHYLWDFDCTPRFKEIPLDLLTQCPKYAHNDASLSSKVAWDVIAEHPERAWNWPTMSQRPDLPLDFVLAHPGLPWRWDMINNHPKLTLQVAADHPELPWDWTRLSRRPMSPIDWEAFWCLPHPLRGWDYYYTAFRMSSNPPNYELILRLPKAFPWSWKSLSTTVPWRLVSTAHPWTWNKLSSRPDIPWPLVAAFPTWPWNWRRLLLNRSLTYALYTRHSSLPWPRQILPKRFGHRAACIIQCHVREYWGNPAYQVCRRRLQREFEDLTGPMPKNPSI